MTENHPKKVCQKSTSVKHTDSLLTLTQNNLGPLFRTVSQGSRGALLGFPGVRSQKVRESSRKLEKVREGWRRLEKVGEGLRRFEKVGEGRRRFEKVRESSRRFEKV